MLGRYILGDDGEPQPVDHHTWSAWMQALDEMSVRIARDEFGRPDDDERVEVSTVFLAVNYQPSDGGPPVLFETMVFGGALHHLQRRYSTRAEAQAGHREVVDEVLRALRRRWGRVVHQN